MAEWADRYWTSVDGLKLHYRDYAGSRERPPILCIPGLTRNARDFEPVADRYAGDWRVICVDLRGRGMSQHDPDSSRYLPSTYVADIMKLLDQEGIADAVFFGTSLGGICTMVLAASDNERIAGALINDIGPDLDPAGISRIGGYVGVASEFGSWENAASLLAERNADVYPRWTKPYWDAFARRLLRESHNRITFDYDMTIADNFKQIEAGPGPDSWPNWRALAGRPVTILRGALSDLLSADTAERMVEELGGDAELVTVPDVGHTPIFDEPEAVAATDRLLERVLAREPTGEPV
jgi:pimeloyl-ACP methyl ester carboxylesterase